jgi:ATP-binding cassette subfamily B protein
MRTLWQYIVAYKKLLISALVLAVINQSFSLLDPQVFRLLVDNYGTKPGAYTSSQFAQGVGLLLLAFIGVAFVSRTAKSFQDYFVNVIVQRVSARLYAQGVEHSFQLPYAVFEDQRSGELLQKLQKARTDVQTFITSAINTLFLAVVGIVLVMAYAFWVHWSIGLTYILMIPILGGVTFFIGRRIKTAQTTIVREQADMAGSTTETLRNVALVKSLGLETQEVDRLNAVNTSILELELKKVRLIRTLSFIQGTTINATRAALIFLLFWLIYSGVITLGEYFTLLFYSFLIFSPLGELGNISTQYYETRASMDQLQAILRIPIEAKPVSPTPIDTLTNIEFKKVGFRYGSSTEDVLSDIELTIKAGETVAFVGPSGSGKSTLVKLIVGLYFPVQGELQFNGTDIRKLDYEALRRRVGLVAQETQLFAGSIRENLLFVNPDATDKECLDMLAAAAATSILERGGKGLDTKIGEGGLKLSGGERQRLAIARALLRQPELLIFDEATSSLDSITEQSITQTIQDIERAHPNVMTVLVAHRLSTVAHAQRIYVLEKGKIVEVGTHDQLTKAGGLYAALWRQQIASRDTTQVHA